MNVTGPLRLSSLMCQAAYFDNASFSVPLFLVEAFDIVYHSLKSEGLFRKSSNATRVKNLKYSFFGEYGIPEGLTVYDVCFLIKQFFREIQEPLLTYELEPQFFKFLSLQHEPTQIRYVLELCHVLPPIHRETLAYLMRKLKHITDFSEYNKMNASNLATVLAPSILRSRCEKSDIVRLLANGIEPLQFTFEKKDAEIKCLLIRILIENAEKIGILTIYEKIMSPDMYDNLLPEDRNCMIYANGNKNLWRINKKKKNAREEQSYNLRYALTPSLNSQRKVAVNQKRLIMNENSSSFNKPQNKDEYREQLGDVSISISQVPVKVENEVTALTEDKPAEMEGKFNKKSTENKKNGAVIRSSSSKVAATSTTLDHKPLRSESDSCVANGSRRKGLPAALSTVISMANDHSPKKKLRRNTGRVSNKNRPSIIEAGVRKTRSAAATQSSYVEITEKQPVDDVPKSEENIVRLAQVPPPCLTTIDENSDFENSDKRKELLQSLTENPADAPFKYPGIRSCRLITDQHILSNESHGVRPSVAYILKTRKGFVRENKALFEGLAKDLREELDASSTTDTPRPRNAAALPSISELYTPTTPQSSLKKTPTAVGKQSPRRKSGVTTPRLSINKLKRSSGGGSGRKSLKRMTNQNGANRKLSCRKYPSSPVVTAYTSMKNRSKLSMLPDLKVTHV